MCLVTWPLNESEAGVDLVMIQTSLLFYVNDDVVMLISKNLHYKSSEVSIKTRSTPASLSFKGHKMDHLQDRQSLKCVKINVIQRTN